MKKLITFFSFLILTSTVFANSVGGSIGGWNVVSNVASGIGSKLTATKDIIINGASKTISSTANITPSPSNVAKFMAKVGGLSLAIDAMNYLLDGVDYVMDPKNNTVTYKHKDAQRYACANMFTIENKFYYSCVSSSVRPYQLQQEDACQSHADATGRTLSAISFDSYCTFRTGSTLKQITVRYVSNPDYAPDSDKTKPATIPVSEIGSRVIDQAEKDIKAGNVASPAVALSRVVAADMVQEAEAENENVKPNPIAVELDKHAAIPTVEDASGTISNPAVVDPVTGEIVKPAETSNVDIKIPKACEWFPQACLFFEWMQKEPEIDEVELPKEEKAKKEINEGLITISSNSCPAPYPVSIELPVLKTVYTDSIDISPYCSEIEKLAPVLQLLAFVLAVFIIKDI